ncbi:MAG: ABC transporter ATP-binding protein [Negativibacillus sp.]
MRHLYNYLKPYIPRMTLGLVIKFTGTIMDLLLPWILSYMIDTVAPQQNVSLIVKWGIVMVLCAVVAVITNIVANRMASWVATQCTRKIRHDLFRKISYLSCAQVDYYTIPSLESRLTSDTYNVHNFISRIQRLGIRAPILLTGGIIITLILEPVLASVLICILPFIAILVYKVSKKGIPLYTNLQKGVDSMVRTVRENITGIRVIKALSKTDREQERFREINAEVARRETTAGVTMSLTNPMMNLFLNLGLTMVIVVGAYRVNAGLTETGKIIAFLTYFTIILNAMLSITRMFVLMSRGAASANRIAEILDTPADLKLSPEDRIESENHIEFDHVSFAYEKSRDHHIKDISFTLKRGESLGIIGATGCGKSTIINLLMRLYDNDEGSIRIDGRKVSSIPDEELHQKFGLVFQNDVLFADTIASNIDFGRSLSMEEIEKAAEDAQAMEFIRSLPDGFQHMLTSKGTNLSGGQKQRVLLSRALAGKPEILILDDSSSALDYKTDSLLRQALRKNHSDTTAIIIAQRISSIYHCDKILVLEEGRTIGYGTHEELMKNCPVYQEISQSQMGGMIDG